MISTKPVLPMLPGMVSQRTSLAVLGMPPRRFLEFVRRHPKLPRFKDGKLVVVPLDSILAFAEPVAANEAEPDEDRVESVDDILASVGQRRVRRIA